MDNLSRRQRSECMSKIGAKGTKPEVAVQRLLRVQKFKFQTNFKGLAGRPDIALLSKRAVIFIHGCFWHKHRCHKGRSLPKSNAAFWNKKREANRIRDRKNVRQLRRLGWRVLVVWECQVDREPYIKQKLIRFLTSPRKHGKSLARRALQ